MAFNTGNPVGSNDPRDVVDTAQVMDRLAHSSEARTPDRFGRERLTWEGLTQQVIDWLSEQGFEAVHLTYVEGQALIVQRPTQLIDYNGSVYRVRAPASFPVALSGAWETDAPLLVDVGDQALRSVISNENDLSQGAAVIGRSMVYVRSIAQLRAIPDPKSGQGYLVSQYFDDLAGGEGVFNWNEASVEDDDGGHIIKSASKEIGRFVRAETRLKLSDFGFSSDRRPANALVQLAASGKVSVFDVNLTNAGDSTALKTPNQVDAKDFRVNGVKLWSDSLPKGMASLPAEFKVRPLFSAFYTGSSVKVTGFDASAFDVEKIYPTVTRYYVDPVAGTAGGLGTEASPINSITNAIAKENASPTAGACVVIHAKPGKYDQTTGLLAGLTKPFSLKCWSADPHARVRCLQGRWGSSLTWTALGGGVYSAPLASVVSVFDDSLRNDLGDPSLMSKAESASSLPAGSWFQNGGTLLLRTLNGRQPDANIGIGRQLSQILTTGTFNTDIYAENFEFLGGAPAAMQIRVASAATKVTFTSKNCKFNYAGGNGAEVYGVSRVLHQDSIGAYNTSDGFNYHSNSSDSSSESVGIEINCLGYRNGYAWSGALNINNGSTAHDNCVMLRYGTFAFENAGPNIADVNGTWSYNFGCIARDSVRSVDSPDKADFDFSGTGGAALCRAWMDSCYAPLGSSSHALTASGDCVVKVRNSQIHPSLYGMTKIQSW